MMIVRDKRQRAAREENKVSGFEDQNHGEAVVYWSTKQKRILGEKFTCRFKGSAYPRWNT